MADQNDMALELGRPDLFARSRRALMGGDRLTRFHFRAREQAVERREQERVEQYRDDRDDQDQIAALLRQKREIEAEIGEDERKFADLRQRGRDGERGR